MSWTCGVSTLPLVIVIASVCAVEAVVPEDKHVYRFGNDIRPSNSSVESAMITCLLSGEVERTGRLFAYSAFFRNLGRVRFQVWRRPNANATSGVLQLIAETPFEPSVNFEQADVYIAEEQADDRCVHVLAGDRIGVFFVDNTGPVGYTFSPSGAVAIATHYTGRAQIGESMLFSSLPFPYAFSLSAFIDTDMSNVSINPLSVFVQCPLRRSSRSDVHAPIPPGEDKTGSFNDDLLCKRVNGFCTSGKCKRGKKWPNMCASSTEACCLVRSHTRDLHCIESGGKCVKGDSKTCDGELWPSLCGRSAKRKCCIPNSMPTDIECVRRGGMCVWLNDTYWNSACSSHQLGPYCGNNHSKRVCCRKNAQEDETCHLSGGACRAKKVSCWNGLYWPDKCGTDQSRKCCILGSRETDKDCVFNHHGQCLKKDKICMFGEFHGDPELCGAKKRKRCCIGSREQKPTAPPVTSPDCGECPCVAVAGDWPGEMADRIASEAKSHSNSRMWSLQSGHRSARGQAKMEMFVAEVLEAVGAKIPHRVLWKWSPIGADEWLNANSSLLKDSCWIPVTGEPRPGDVVSDGVDCGIVTGDSLTTRAASEWIVNDKFGFESGANVVFWRVNCSCDNSTTTTSSMTTRAVTTQSPQEKPIVTARSPQRTYFACERHLGVRLLSENGNPGEGLVQLYHDGEWGTLCKNDTRKTEGDILCRMMGFSSARSFACCGEHNYPDSDKDAPIMMASLHCSDNETNIYDCKHGPWTKTFPCDHELDATLQCADDISNVTSRPMGVNETDVIADKSTIPWQNIKFSTAGFENMGTRCIATEFQQSPWLRIDLGDVYDVSHLWFHQENNTMQDIDIELAIHHTDNYTMCAQIVGEIPESMAFVQCCNKPVVGRYLLFSGRQAGKIQLCALSVRGVKHTPRVL